jgi:NAD(P)-dependent dehydrogenase (short-subunit alcohol dehydrogenase family)
LATKVDVRDGAAINAAVEACVETYGTPDVLINSAGIADSNIKAETYDPAVCCPFASRSIIPPFLSSPNVKANDQN